MNSKRYRTHTIPRDVEACLKCMKIRMIPEPIRRRVCAALSKHQGKTMTSNEIAIALRDALHEGASKQYLCFRLVLYRMRRQWMEALVDNEAVLLEVEDCFDRLMSWHGPKVKRIAR